MPRPVNKEATVFLTNCGQQENENFFEQVKEAMKLVVTKRIFLRPNDEIAIALSGYSGTEVESSDGSVAVLWKCSNPSWQLVTDILNLRKSNERVDDWHTALNDTIEYIENYVTATKKILIMIMDCEDSCPNIDTIDPAYIANSLTELGIQFLWIGTKDLMDLPAANHNTSEKILLEVLKQVDGEYMTIEKSLPVLRIFKKSESRYMAWKCNLEIGPISIPTATFVEATEAMKAPTFKTAKLPKDPENRPVLVGRPDRCLIDKYKVPHSVSETVFGYMYGRKFVPVSEADESGMTFLSGFKSMKLFGFAPRDAIKLEDLGGNSSRVVVPATASAAKPFSSLIQAMDEMNYVAIVRRVYQRNSEPKMCVMIPRLTNEGEPLCLVLIEILYAEDRRVQRSQPLNSIVKELSNEKLDIVDNLIDSMMLTGTADDEEDDPFVSGTVPSPSLQHIWNCLAHRALHPDDPIPPMDENLVKLIRAPESVRIKQEPLLGRVKELFPIKIPEKTHKKQPSTSIPTRIPTPDKAENNADVENPIETDVDMPAQFPDESNIELDELFDDVAS